METVKWYLRTQDETFGPETEAKLIEWAKLGRIQPGQEISDDEIVWQRVEDVPFLDMRFSIDIGDGNPRGPFNRAAAEALLASGRLPKISRIVEVRAPFEEEISEGGGDRPEEERAVEPAVGASAEQVAEPADRVSAEKVVEKIVEKEVRVEVPVEKIVEKIVEVPVEKIVEKEVVKEVVKEVKVEVPVEKIVVDETRVKELEGLLSEERRHTTELQTRMDAMSKKASEDAMAATERESSLKAKIRDQETAAGGLKAELAARDERIATLTSALKDATDRENKYVEQVGHLEDELRRLPQAASEVADIQAAMYGIMTSEADEIARLIEIEKKEYEDARCRYQKRADRLLEHRREILKRAGSSIEDMTHKALVNRPEDPRTAQLRKELEELQRLHERSMRDSESKVRDLSERLRVRDVEQRRSAAEAKDIAQLRQETVQLREILQRTEKDLLVARQRNEELMRQQETKQQALMARLASLESPSIGTAQTMETNQSREAKQVKLPSWMRLKH